MNRGFQSGYRAYSAFQGSARTGFTNFTRQAQAANFSTMNYQFKMMQVQQQRLSASNMLITSIQLNELIRDSEAEAGQVANSSEDAEVEDDDGTVVPDCVRCASRRGLEAREAAIFEWRAADRGPTLQD